MIHVFVLMVFVGVGEEKRVVSNDMHFFDITIFINCRLRNFSLRKQFFVRKISKLLWLH